ncbi:MAG TPA: TlpA disulfide reductase family protein [Bacillales bacterium]
MNKKWFYLLFSSSVIAFLLSFSGTLDRASGNQLTGSKPTNLYKVKDDKETTRPRAPNFTLKSLKGDQLSLNDFRGRYVLLNMWASWCAPCRQEASSLVRIDEAFSDKQLMVIGVNMTSQESSLSNVEAFVKKHNIRFPILLDQNGNVMDLYRVLGIPTTYLLDRKGRVMERFRGVITLDKITEILNGPLVK